MFNTLKLFLRVFSSELFCIILYLSLVLFAIDSRHLSLNQSFLFVFSVHPTTSVAHSFIACVTLLHCFLTSFSPCMPMFCANLFLIKCSYFLATSLFLSFPMSNCLVSVFFLLHLQDSFSLNCVINR